MCGERVSMEVAFGWWQLKYIFVLIPKLGDDEPILTHIFQVG